MIRFELLGARFFATHSASAEAALAGAWREATPPAFALLTGRARRFTSLVAQLHLEVLGALQPLVPAGSPSVFATCHGEIQTAEKMIADFDATAMVSAAQFAQSVHNTPSGLYAIATGNLAPTTTFTGDNAIAAAWLVAALMACETERPVVLSVADEPVPPALLGPAEPGGVAAAFLVGPTSGAGLPALLSIDDQVEQAAPEGPLRLLARAVRAVAERAKGDLSMGSIQPGAVLRLQL